MTNRFIFCISVLCTAPVAFTPTAIPTSARLVLHLADYVVTEAGFGSDLGAEKLFNIKCGVRT